MFECRKKREFYLMAEMTSFMHASEPKQIDNHRKILDKKQKPRTFPSREPISPIWIASRRCKINNNIIDIGYGMVCPYPISIEWK